MGRGAMLGCRSVLIGVEIQSRSDDCLKHLGALVRECMNNGSIVFAQDCHQKPGVPTL